MLTKEKAKTSFVYSTNYYHPTTTTTTTTLSTINAAPQFRPQTNKHARACRRAIYTTNTTTQYKHRHLKQDEETVFNRFCRSFRVAAGG